MRGSHASSSKRSHDQIVINDTDKDQLRNTASAESLHGVFQFDPELNFRFNTSFIEVNTKKLEKFQLSINRESQEACVKAVARLFLFKGMRKEVVTRTYILDTISKIDEECKSLADIVLLRAQELLLKTTGYMIINGSQIKGLKKDQAENIGKNDYFLTNTLNSNILKCILSKSCLENPLVPANNKHQDKEKAFSSFLFLLGHCLINSSGYHAKVNDLLRLLCKIDSRFPQTLTSSTVSSSKVSKAVFIEELGEDFPSLLQRLKKERFIDVSRDRNDPDDIGKSVVSLGPRFFLEIGKKVIFKSYFMVLDEPVNEAVLQEMDREAEEEDDEED